jgi:hypothetical protein
MDFANAVRIGSLVAREGLIGELENVARDIESMRTHHLKVASPVVDRTMRSDLRGWGRGVARKLRRYKWLAVSGGPSEINAVTVGLTADFILACRGEWLAIARATTGRMVPARLVVAGCLSAAVAVATGVVTNLVTDRPTAGLIIALAVLGVATVVLSAWSAVLSQARLESEPDTVDTILKAAADAGVRDQPSPIVKAVNRRRKGRRKGALRI